jgi:hypothetical protein
LGTEKISIFGNFNVYYWNFELGPGKQRIVVPVEGFSGTDRKIANRPQYQQALVTYFRKDVDGPFDKHGQV